MCYRVLQSTVQYLVLGVQFESSSCRPAENNVQFTRKLYYFVVVLEYEIGWEQGQHSRECTSTGALRVLSTIMLYWRTAILVFCTPV